jgi:hypothetical protein
MDTVDAKWELACTEVRAQVMSTDETEEIDEMMKLMKNNSLHTER